MPNDHREERAEFSPVSLAWGVHAVDGPHAEVEGLPLWLAGGACVLLWTAIAMLLTA